MSKDGPIYQKFTVTRTDGSFEQGGKHYHCFQFVLDVDHDPFALPALTAYANACRKTRPELAKNVERIVSERAEHGDLET